MTKFTVLFLGILLINGYFAEDEIKEDEGVLVLNDENFDAAIKKHSNILVELYAPWCGHCQKLAPEYAKAAQRLAKEDLPIKLAKVDATENQALHDKYITRGYPTIKFFQNGEAIDFNGKRDRNGIVEWLKSKTGLTVKTLETAEEIDEFTKRNNVVLVGYYKDEKEAEEFKKLAISIEDIPIGFVSDAKLAEKALKLKKNGLVLFKASDSESLKYEDKLAGVKDWLEKNKKPLISEFSQSDANLIFGGDQKEFIVLFYKESEGTQKLKNDFRTAAKQFKGTIQFVQVNVLVETNDRIGDFFGVNPEDIPTIRAMSRKDGLKKYQPSKNKLGSSDIAKFAEDFKADKLELYLKSEKLPEDWDQGLITVLVGKNFDQVARDPKKHVLVEFYAPWCVHCQNLIPVWDRLGELYKDNENVIIAKMDATLNEVDGITIRALPTISLFPKDKKENVDFTGELNLKEIVEFLVKETGEEPNGEVEEPKVEGEETAEQKEGEETKEKVEEATESAETDDSKEEKSSESSEEHDEL
ncbi:unnamed protein product [Bursaphelenchus xylophilus]|uniref:Protein disulfide-isomerase n=1 Tax=Bursaphelenchus xylophilus TaxID=6326 RepID=A0A1I7SQV6_BURXY|nr:unnamed protein product [Bursaphelenchus xylophilus]CAG9110453.1 unnamed protein product [Bursaphelenchus xylophilus]